MAENSKIEWCSHTFNIVWGCQRWSPACENCYAESLAKRYGHQVWGPPSTTPRRVLSEYWRQPLKWNAAAEKAGERARVFCSSMADVFEDHPTVEQERQKLWPLIEQTPNLDWQLLTKRPENVMAMMPAHWNTWSDGFPRNVWVGTTVENQEYADKRIPELLKVPAVVRFLSMEPLLGPVDLSKWLHRDGDVSYSIHPQRPRSLETQQALETMVRVAVDTYFPRPNWIITGGESGPHARPGHPDWYRSLRDQCQAAGVPFYFKQWGEWKPGTDGLGTLIDFSADGSERPTLMARVGKHNAGRELDGRTWDEFPQPMAVPA